jgi:hypothetical protein
MSENEAVEEVEAEAVEGDEAEAGRRGRVSKYPDEIAAEAQKVYRKVYNRQFKANQTILKAGGDVEVTAKVAALEAKNAWLVESGYEV